MKPNYAFFTTILYFFNLYSSVSQSTPAFSCGFDDWRSPQLAQGIQGFEEQLQQHFSLKKAKTDPQNRFFAPPYVIPVVVHIIHDGGPENISDVQVFEAIEHLNEGFAAQGYFAQQGGTLNTQIQFCMARRDPDGNATNGITRNQSPLTNMISETQDLQTKDLNRWNPKDYVNIWVVKEITSLASGAGVSGYAFFPSVHGEPQDGMICEALTFGVNASLDAVLIHEMGHYLGLYHTFEGGCANNDCNFDGDRVCDTPPDNATHTACPFNSCNTDVAPGSPFLSDVNDLTGDFMDYSPFGCYAYFTADQAARMQGSLETARKSLLESPGCLSPCSLPITASFLAAPNPIMAGGTVSFTNTSVNGASFSWTEGGVEFAQTQDASRVFTTVGAHTIVLTAGNADPNCSANSIEFVTVECTLQASFLPSQLEALEGATLTFTNTSTGAPGLIYEWSVNGQSVSNAADLSFLFPNAENYTVSLKITGQYCQSEASVNIKIGTLCGLFPDPVKIAYTAQKKLFQIRDMVETPDGGSIQCGEHFQFAMVSKWDQDGNLIWHKETPGNGSFTQIDAMPDGNFLLTGEGVAASLYIAKIDGDGNFLWIKTMSSTEGDIINPRQYDILAVNPDGTFGIVYKVEFTDSTYLTKFTPDGNEIWSRKINLGDQPGSLHIAKDGSGDFVFLTYRSYNSPGKALRVLFFGQNGTFKAMHEHGIPNLSIAWIQNFDLSLHPDGGYTVFYTTGAFPLSQDLRLHMYRFEADGTLRWGKRDAVFLAGFQHRGAYIRQLPDEKGWLVLDSRRDAATLPLGDYLMRLDTGGQILWTRHLGDTPTNDIWVMPPAYQSGGLRSLHGDFFNQDMILMDMPDSDADMDCAPIVPHGIVWVPLFPSTVKTSPSVVPKSVSMIPVPISFFDVPLTRRELCSVIPICPEVCDNALDDDEDGFVDCFDADCDCFVQDTFCRVALPPNQLSAKLAWQSPVDAAHLMATPMVANLNPQQDSIPEILVIPSSTDHLVIPSFELLIFKGDGSNAANPNILQLPAGLSNAIAANPTVADLDKNGIPEVILVTNDNRIRVFTAFDPAANPCMTLWVSATQLVSSGATRAYVADFDSDGVSEIFSGNDVFQLDLTNPSAPILNKVLDGFGAEGQMIYLGAAMGASSATAADLLSRADCNGDPDCDGLEIAAGTQIYAIDLEPNDGDGLEIKIVRDLSTMDPSLTHQDGYTSVADLNLDGIPELLVSGTGSAAERFYVWNKNGLLQNFSPGSNAQVNGMICIANVFDDRTAGFAQDFPEIIASSSNRLTCWNLQKAQTTPNQPSWWDIPILDASGAIGVTAFDFNGDGNTELVFRDEQNLRVIYGGATPFPAGVDAARNWFQIPTGSGTFDEYPVIADVDQDGSAEIVVTGSVSNGPNNSSVDQRGRLRIFESDQNKWLPARPIWNQQNYFGVNINDDLSVPRVQQKHWLILGPASAGKRPFNTHLAQINSLNPLESNRLKTPDASIALDSVRCIQDSIALFFQVCNQGSAELPAGTPIAFYLGDPTLTAAPLLFSHLLSTENLGPGLCEKIYFKVPATYNANIFAVINDDGSLTTPFSLTANFPSTNQPECDYSNNIRSFSIPYQSPNLDLGPDISLCKNSIFTFSAGPNFQQYRWQDGSVAANFTAYSAGKYWVDAQDACGYWHSDTVNILLNALAALSLPDEIVRCKGQTVELSAAGFSKYTWSPVTEVSCSDCDSVQIVVNQTVTIQLTATEGDCFVSDSVHLIVNPSPEVQLVVQNGDCDTPASINASVLGAGPFSFVWSNSSTDTSITNLISGTYTVEVIDPLGCKTLDSAAVFVASPLELQTVSASPTCPNLPTGSIDVSWSGGLPPIQFLWSNNASSEDLSNLLSGVYTVIATDSNGCTSSLTQTLTDPPALSLNFQSADLNCPGDTGLISVQANGGTPNYSFLWSTSATTQDLNIYQSGTYTVSVLDANGCIHLDSTSIAILGSIPVLSLSTDTLTCQKTSVDIFVSANLLNTSFLWTGSNGFSSTVPNPSVSSPGLYSVTATEPLGGCTALGAVLVPIDTAAPSVVFPVNQIEMPCGQDTLSFSATGSSSGPAFVAQWEATAGGAVLSGSNALQATFAGGGTYTLTITQLQNSCSASNTVDVILMENPVALLQADSVKCFGENNGAIQVASVTDGTAPFLYSLDNQSFQEESLFENLSAGDYHVYVLDAENCLASSSILVGQPEAVTVNLSGESLVPQGANTLLQATVQPGNLMLSQIEWTANGQSFIETELQHSIQLSENTLFQITIADEHGCTASDNWLVEIDETNKVYVPNVIALENASAANRLFVVFGGYPVQEIESLNIFDRWGNLIFSNQHFQPNDESEAWDATFNGQLVTPGVFVWVLKVQYKDGSSGVLKGNLTVIR